MLVLVTRGSYVLQYTAVPSWHTMTCVIGQTKHAWHWAVQNPHNSHLVFVAHYIYTFSGMPCMNKTNLSLRFSPVFPLEV